MPKRNGRVPNQSNKTRTPRKPRAKKHPNKPTQEPLEAVTHVTPTKPVINDKILHDTCTPITKNIPTTKDHGPVNQDDTLKSAEKNPEKDSNTSFSYKGAL